MLTVFAQHLTTALGAGKGCCGLLLYVLAHSDDAGARAVAVDSRAVADLLGTPARTVRRWIGRLLEAAIFEEAGPGRYRIAAGALPELAQRPWWHPIRPWLLAELLRLQRHAQAGDAALRLALYLIGPLRAAAARGRTLVPVPAARACADLGISAATFRTACDHLDAANLVRWRRAPGRPRHAPTFSRLVAGLAVTDEAAPALLARIEPAELAEDPRTFRCPPPDIPLPPSLIAERSTPGRTHTRTREASPLTETRRLVSELLGGQGSAADRIARAAGTPERLRRWIAQEAPELDRADNPFGRLHWLAFDFPQSRPDSPSWHRWQPDPGRPWLLVPIIEAPTADELADEAERSALAAAARCEAYAGEASRLATDAGARARAAGEAGTVAELDRRLAEAEAAAAGAGRAATDAAELAPDAAGDELASERAETARSQAALAALAASYAVVRAGPANVATRAALAAVESARADEADKAANRAARHAFDRLLRRRSRHE